MIALLLLVAAAPIALDVDAVGLSPLERAAVDERLREELGDVVETKGLVVCGDDAACAGLAVAAAGLPVGAAVRIVKVLQVVRIDAVAVDAEGAVVARSSRRLAVEAAARGPLLDPDAAAAVRARAGASSTTAPPASGATADAGPNVDATAGARGPTTPAPPSTSPAPSAEAAAEEGPSLLLLGGGALGAVLLVGSGVVVAHEALVAHDPGSLGDDKERARVLGPFAVVVGLVGALLVAGGATALFADGA